MINIDGGLYAYKEAIGKYPSTSEGLNALMVNLGNNDKWKGPYLNKADLNDPWGYPYRYTLKADGSIDLRSFGADGRPGGTLDNEDLLHQNTDWEEYEQWKNKNMLHNKSIQHDSQ